MVNSIRTQFFKLIDWRLNLNLGQWVKGHVTAEGRRDFDSSFVKHVMASKMGFISGILGRLKDGILFGPRLAHMFVSDLYSQIKNTVLTVVTLLVILGVLMWTSVFLYGSFYYSYMPAVLHTRDVNLQFR